MPDDNVCPGCGQVHDEDDESLDLLQRLWAEVDGHAPDLVLDALIQMQAELLALAPPEIRHRVRREGYRMLTRLTKHHVVQNCDA